MGLKDTVKKATSSAAGIAAATTGLSTCHDGGGIVVDPPPPPLICSSVAGGQTFVMTASRTGDVVTVKVKQNGYAVDFWQVTRVGDAVGATIGAITLPQYGIDSLVVAVTLETPNTTQVDFTVEGKMSGGYPPATCDIRRTIHLTIGAAGIQVAESRLDELPLKARDAAQVVMVERNDRTVRLEARTGYAGHVTAAWEVTGGTLSEVNDRSTQWTLPDEPGVYQAEVLLDYGPDGMAFDALMLEVR